MQRLCGITKKFFVRFAVQIYKKYIKNVQIFTFNCHKKIITCEKI